MLTTRHGHGVIIKDFVGDIDLGCDGLAKSKQAGMIVGAIAEISEDVGFRHERRLSHPRHTFTAHLGEGIGVAVHPLDHVVAADPC